VQTSSFDILRFVVPGGIVVVLSELTLRVVSGDISASVFVDDVGIAIFLAFGSGVVLYFIDIAYATPQFWRGIPSQYFQEQAIKSGIPEKLATEKSLGIFLTEIEQRAPRLHQRSLLFGALYRIGFQLIFFSMVAAVGLPVLLLSTDSLMNAETLGTADPVKLAWILLSTSVLLVVALLRTFKPFLRDSDTPRGKKILRSPLLVSEIAPEGVRPVVIACSTVGVLGWLIGWSMVVGDRHVFGLAIPDEPSEGRWLIAGTSALAIVIWAFVRLVGPLSAWWSYLRTPGARKPDRPHSGSQVDSLDASIAIGPVVALFLVGDSLAIGQIATISGLLAGALWLAHLRKYERQLSGIYRNQRDWLDRNLPAVLASFGEPHADQPEPKETTDLHGRRRSIGVALAVLALAGVARWLRREKTNRS
jgi:hypothetical protein